MRTADDRAEASLQSYTQARATDLLTAHTVAAMLAGLSTRRGELRILTKQHDRLGAPLKNSAGGQSSSRSAASNARTGMSLRPRS